MNRLPYPMPIVSRTHHPTQYFVSSSFRSVNQMLYSWNRTDGKPMPSSANFSDYNRVMFIPNIQLSHAGRYQCSVSRQLGQWTKEELFLTVEGIVRMMMMMTVMMTTIMLIMMMKTTMMKWMMTERITEIINNNNNINNTSC